MSGYLKGFYIDRAVSNNAFSYSRRKNRRLYVPPLLEGSLKDVEPGEEVVFEDFDDNGILQSCPGLKNFIATDWRGVPLFIVDNHNHVFYFWHEALKDGEKGLTLVHIDCHKDSRLPESFLETADAVASEKVFQYTNTVLNVGNFIPAAIHTGIIKRVINVTSKREMDDFSLNGEGKIILDLDLDFFAPEMDYIGATDRINFIKKLLPEARLITAATSPFFISCERAINYLLKIFS